MLRVVNVTNSDKYFVYFTFNKVPKIDAKLCSYIYVC